MPDETPKTPKWICQECGHVSLTKPFPTDRDAFYAKVAKNGSPKCPKCKSEGFMPSGL